MVKMEIDTIPQIKLLENICIENAECLVVYDMESIIWGL